MDNYARQCASRPLSEREAFEIKLQHLDKQIQTLIEEARILKMKADLAQLQPPPEEKPASFPKTLRECFDKSWEEVASYAVNDAWYQRNKQAVDRWLESKKGKLFLRFPVSEDAVLSALQQKIREEKP